MKHAYWVILIVILVARAFAHIDSPEKVPTEETSKNVEHEYVSQEGKVNVGFADNENDKTPALSPNEEKIDWDKIDAHELEKEFYWLAIEDGLTDFAEIHEKIGEALLRAGNKSERAAVHFKKAVELDPERSNSWFKLALIYSDTEEGIEYMIKAAKTNPYFPIPYFLSAIGYYEKGVHEKSEEMFVKYLELAEGWPGEEKRIRIAQKMLGDLRLKKHKLLNKIAEINLWILNIDKHSIYEPIVNAMKNRKTPTNQ